MKVLPLEALHYSFVASSFDTQASVRNTPQR